MFCGIFVQAKGKVFFHAMGATQNGLNLWNKRGNSSVGRAQPCPKKIRMQHCLSMLGSRVWASFCNATPFCSRQSEKVFPLLSFVQEFRSWGQLLAVFFCLCMLRGVLGPQMGKGRVMNFTGRLFSSEHNRWFATDNIPLQILRDNDRRITLTANRIPLSQWFNEQCDKLRQSIRQPIQPKKNRGLKL